MTSPDAEMHAPSKPDDSSRAINIDDSPGATVNNRGIIAGRDVINVALPRAEPLTPERLAEALALLDALPTGDDDPIPEPQALSVPHRIELVSNPYFVGRDDELRQLARTLKDGQTCAVTTGIGGVGKTQLAVEFARRYGRFFAGGVFWLSFADAANVDSEVAACGRPGALNLFLDAAQLKQDEQVAMVRDAWEEPLPRLLVFDNCEDPQLLRKWKPERGGCRVLVTSRATNWPGTLGVRRLSLDVLSRPESVRLLRRYRDDLPEDDASLAALCEEVGDLPLALHLVGSFLELYRDDPLLGDPAQVLEDLRSGPLLEKANELAQDVSDSPTKHDLDVARSFALSYRQLDAANPLDATAISLLFRAAHLAPGEPIPRELLLETLGLPKGDAAAQRQAARALGQLTGLGLLEGLEGGVLRLHRLLGAFVLAQPDAAEAQGAVERALISTAYRINEAGYPSAMQPILLHLRHITELALRRTDESTAKLCNNLGYHLKATGAYVAARPLYERALVISEHLLGLSHSDTARSLNNLAELLRLRGDYATARPLLERALAIREHRLGPSHPDTARSLNSLAELLRAQGDYARARPLYERALAIQEQTLGPNHPDTATSLNNLALLLRAQGDYATARPLLECALAIREHRLGPSHPDTARSLNNLAGLLHDQGDYAAARLLYERALAIREQVLDPSHPDTATSLNNLAFLLCAQGEYEAAYPLYERSLAICQQMLGPNHPNTATSLNNLAGLLHDQGDYVAARRLYERALAIREQVLDPSHPDTAGSLCNLALLFAYQGDFQAALPLVERALVIYEYALGVNHPFTQQTRRNYDVLRQAAQGQHPQAETRAQQIDRITQEAERATDQALAADAQTRAQLAAQLEAQAQWAADGEEDGSPYLALAAHLRALAERLRGDEDRGA
jgi:tetratricopeptide (TPR) repeat protein